MQVNSLKIAEQIYTEAKYWTALIGGLWFIFRGIQWVRAIRENDLLHLQSGVDALHTELKEQTGAIVGELRELRQDLRTFYPRS